MGELSIVQKTVNALVKPVPSALAGVSLANNTVPGRMIVKGENPFDALANTCNANVKLAVNVIGPNIRSIGDVLANNTPAGRMITKGESFPQAWKTAAKNQLGIK